MTARKAETRASPTGPIQFPSRNEAIARVKKTPVAVTMTPHTSWRRPHAPLETGSELLDGALSALSPLRAFRRTSGLSWDSPRERGMDGRIGAARATGQKTGVGGGLPSSGRAR